MSKQLYLCQCIAALSLVRTGGHFVVKLFDLFTEFSVGLMYLMYKSFRQSTYFDKNQNNYCWFKFEFDYLFSVCIHKPHTSRPANSERYLICKWKNPSCDTIERYLFDVNIIINEKAKDVRNLVPLSVLKQDTNFYKYIYDSNNRFDALYNNMFVLSNNDIVLYD